MLNASVQRNTVWGVLVALVLAIISVPASAQCTNTSSYGSATIDFTGANTTISTCTFPGEYSPINGASQYQSLRFASSVATDYITIHSGTFNGAVVAFGPTPLVVSNTFTGSLFAHWSADAMCGTQTGCRTTSVQFIGCAFTSSFGSGAVKLDGSVTTLSTCSFPGEYSTISGAVNGQTLRFTSNTATDYITIHSGTRDGPVVAYGPTPLVFANTYTGTLFAHWSANTSCGTLSACRLTTVQLVNLIFRDGFE